jgi:ribosomal protein S18 acetylase RimI-like enzyme
VTEVRPEFSTRVATAQDAAALATVLGRAFREDPVMAWIHPNPDDRERRVSALFYALAERIHLRHRWSEIAEAEDPLGGALWDPPGEWRVGIRRTLAVLPSLTHALGGSTARALQVSSAFERVHPRRPHAYLAYLGTTPDAQGIGVGSTLMHRALERIDAARLPAYLESSDEANVGYYERFGFRVVGAIHLPFGPRVPTMWRDRAR